VFRWSVFQTNYLIENFEKVHVDSIARHLGRSHSSIIAKAQKLRLLNSGKWTSQEDEILRSKFNTETHDQIALRLSRSAKAVGDRARRLNITGSWARRWTNEDHDYLMRNYKKLEIQEIATFLNRTLVAVNLRIATFKNGNSFPKNGGNFNAFLTGKIGYKPRV